MRVWHDIRKVAAVGTVVAVVLAAAPTLLADRPTDKDVRALIEKVNQERDRFEDQLDGKIKNSIIRGPNGEVHVERYLDDLQDNVDAAKALGIDAVLVRAPADVRAAMNGRGLL